MKTVFSIFFFSLFFLSCKKETSKKPLAIKTNEIILVSKSFSDSEPKACKGGYNCGEIEIETLVIKEKTVRADSINEAILKTISNCLNTDENPNVAKNYEDVIQRFKKSYANNVIEMKNDSVMGWSANAHAKIEYQSDKLLNISVNYDMFTGGAHPYGAIKSLLFDTKTGKIIPNEKLFLDVKKVTTFVETKFRKNQEISHKISLEEAGYFFENGIFTLSENILFSDKEVTFHYNQYEAASYAQGPIDIVIPYTEIEKYLLIK